MSIRAMRFASLFLSRSSDGSAQSDAIPRPRAARGRSGRDTGNPTKIPEPSRAAADALLDRVLELPAATWIMIGRAIASEGDARAARRPAEQALERLLADERLHILAWELRDAVDTTASLARHRRRRWSRAELDAFRLARDAAVVAALALLAGDQLPPETVTLLCAPFASAADPHGFAPRLLTDQM